MIRHNLAKLTNQFRYIDWVGFALAHWQEVLAALVICVGACHAKCLWHLSCVFAICLCIVGAGCALGAVVLTALVIGVS